MTNKGLVIGLGVIVGVLAVICGFMFSQNMQLQNNVQQLNHDLQNLQASYSTLQSNYSRLQMEFIKLQANHSELVSEYNLLQNKYELLTKNYTTLKTNFTSLSQNYEALLRKHQSLQNSYTTLKQCYNELSTKYIVLQDQYNKLQENYTQLQSQYAALSKEYSELKEELKPLEEARKTLKNLAGNVSTSNLFNYIKETYQKALGSEAQYLLLHARNTPYDVDPQYFAYLFESSKYTGELIIDWNIKGSNYYVMVMDIDNLFKFYSGEDYYVIDYSFENEKKPLYINTNVGQTYAFIVDNRGTSSIRIYNLTVYEKIGVYAPNDVRKIYAVNYHIATNVPYVYDIGEEAKPPLETLREGGDCEDRAVLAASMLLALGYSPSKIALALVDTNGDGEADHVSCLAQLPAYYTMDDLAYDLARLTILFTHHDPYADYYTRPNVMVVPASLVNGSNGQGYFIVIDPPDLTKETKVAAPDLLPGNVEFSTYNVIYAETVESLLS